MVGDGKGMYHYKVCKAIRIDVCSYSHIYVYTAIQECTYMTIWKYRNTAIKICRYVEKGQVPYIQQCGQCLQVSALPLLGAFSCSVPEGESDTGEQAPTASLMFNLEGSRFIIRVWGGKPHRFFRHKNSRSEMPGDT